MYGVTFRVLMLISSVTALQLVSVHPKPDRFLDLIAQKQRRERPQKEALHQAYGRWHSLLEPQNLSPLMPPNHTGLRQIPYESLSPGVLLTNKPTDCNPTSDISAPLRERAVCRWYWTANHDPQRIPEVLPQVHCCSDKIMLSNVQFECQSVTYKVRVMKYNESSHEMIQATENIALACVATNQARGNQALGAAAEVYGFPQRSN